MCLNERGGSGSTVNELNMRENRGATREESRSHLKTYLLFMEVGKRAAKRHVWAKGSWPTSDERMGRKRLLLDVVDRSRTWIAARWRKQAATACCGGGNYHGVHGATTANRQVQE